MKSQQRAAIRTLDVDHAIEQEVPQRREQLAEPATDHRADRLRTLDELVEPRVHNERVCTERAQRTGGRTITKSLRFSSRMNDSRSLALRELATQLVVELA